MKILRTANEVWQTVDRTKSIGFVPTMGALHEGHVSLLKKARGENEILVGSLFVNPTQFGPSEDFTRYPRNEERDAELCRGAGVDYLFAPGVDEMYPTRDTVVAVHGVSERWEGQHRPGHFAGVATVVCKLFNVVLPTRAYFGQKDLQQLAVIRRMVLDLRMPIEIIGCPTIREGDGLALSSRNVYLSTEERRAAPAIYKALTWAAKEIAQGNDTEEVLDRERNTLAAAGFDIQYFALVDTDSFVPLTSGIAGASIIFAGYLGKTRLIDNVQLPR